MHEMQKPCFWEKQKKIYKSLSAEFAHRVVAVNPKDAYAITCAIGNANLNETVI